MAQDFLQHEAKGASIARLLIAGGQHVLYGNYAHGSPHNTYQSGVAEIERDGMPQGPMVRLLAIGGQGKLSYVEKGALTEEILFGSADPTILHDGKYSYEFLHLTLTQFHLRGDPYGMTVYLKALSGVSIGSLSRTYSMLQRLTKIEDLRSKFGPIPGFWRCNSIPQCLHSLDLLRFQTQYATSGHLQFRAVS